MRHVYTACLISILMLAQGASAQSVVYDVRPAGGASSPISVAPGGTVDYEITISVDSVDNDGLLFFFFDLLTDLGVDQSVDSVVFDPLIVDLFSSLLPLSPGIPDGDDILQIGGTQGFAPATPGVGQNGAQLIVSGQLVTPRSIEDTFTVTISNPATQLFLGGSIIPDSSIDTTIGPGFVIDTNPPDADDDGVTDAEDNCPVDANANQEDEDGDEVGDVCDNCVSLSNPEQADCDGDEVGDVCSLAAGDRVFASDGPATGTLDAETGQAQDIHLDGPALLRNFEIGYSASISAPVTLTLALYANNPENTVLPPSGLIAEYEVGFTARADGSALFLGEFDPPVQVPADLWAEVTLSDSTSVPVVLVTTTDEMPAIGHSDGLVYDTDGEVLDTGRINLTLSRDSDCNGNDVPDNCDISDGTSDDCNASGVPDECELPDDADCDDNGVLDECDADCDGNGTPDGCEADADGDGVPDACDNCPDEANPDQADEDGNGTGDLCEDGGPIPPIGGGGGNGGGGGSGPPPTVGGPPGDLSEILAPLATGGAALMAILGSAISGHMLGGPAGFVLGLILGVFIAILSLFGGLPPTS